MSCAQGRVEPGFRWSVVEHCYTVGVYLTRTPEDNEQLNIYVRGGKWSRKRYLKEWWQIFKIFQHKTDICRLEIHKAVKQKVHVGVCHSQIAESRDTTQVLKAVKKMMCDDNRHVWSTAHFSRDTMRLDENWKTSLKYWKKTSKTYNPEFLYCILNVLIIHEHVHAMGHM